MSHATAANDPPTTPTDPEQIIDEPRRPGTSTYYLGGRPLRRYILWFTLTTAAFTATWGAVGGVLLPNHVQILEFGQWFTGLDSSIDLQQLQTLRDQVEAGTVTATVDQLRQLDLLAKFDAARAQSLSWVTALGVLGTMLIQPIVGVVSDRTRSRLGRRAPWMLFGALVGAACLAGVRFAPTIAVLALLWTVAQVVLNMALSPMNVTLADRVSANSRGTVSGLVGLGTFAGGVVGGVGAGLGFASLGLDIYFVLALAIALTVTCFVVLLPDQSSRDLAVPPHRWGEFFRGFLVPLRSRDFRLVWTARVVLTFGYAMSTALAIYMMQSYIRPALSAADATKIFPLMTFASLPGTIVAILIAGRLSDRLGRRKPFVVVASLLMATSMLVPLFWPTLTALFIQAALAGIAFGIYLPVDQALFVDVLPDPDSAGRDLGVAGLGSNLGQALGPVLAGQIVALSGGYGLIWVGAFVLVGVSAFVILPVKNAR